MQLGISRKPDSNSGPLSPQHLVLAVQHNPTFSLRIFEAFLCRNIKETSHHLVTDLACREITYRNTPSRSTSNLPVMPPKKVADQPKKVRASVDDKTFGMKNKKGSTAKKQIAQLQAQSKTNVSPEEKRKQAEKEQKAKEKAAAEAAKKEAADLFKPVSSQKVPFGVDPKTVLCQFFKKGHCDKGRKCKFSHDLDIERKGQKRDLYQDTREAEKQEKEKDNMDDWDEEKLRKVVMSKHGNPKTTTDKVCKYFIQAVEEGKYGWFWACPNGGDKCMYRHSLPPGYDGCQPSAIY